MRTPPVLVLDGDCGFRTTAVRVIERGVRPRRGSIAWRRADLEAFGVTRERARHEVLRVTPLGTVHGGSGAVAEPLLSAGGAGSLPGTVLTPPPVRRAAHDVCRLMADNRSRLPGTTEACSPPDTRAHRT